MKLKAIAIFLSLAIILSACSDEANNSKSSADAVQINQLEKENKTLVSENESLKKQVDDLTNQINELNVSPSPEAKTTAVDENQVTEQNRTAEMMKLFIPEYDNAASIDPKTYDFLVNNHKLFPALTLDAKNQAKTMVNANITSKHLFKNISQYLDKMIKVTGTVVNVSEQKTDSETIAEIHVLDEFGNSTVGVYLNSTGDILEGDTIAMRGVPTIVYSFDNVGGGTTNAILIAVSTIQKVQ
ncbi:bZIP transcription factor [Paenibacillus apii]|uniref:bZIP transcription factor n=1 Tax=Paenibacillus apii TaxID=1850370 RepID=UPI001438EA46|nr:bZIP transcription factor [Paenibacillus apii]NJJ37874.1 hypothetical protein [Paenibacillus apii]